MNIPLKSRIARRFSSLLPRAGLIPPPSRPQGISAIMRVWNENTWLEDSIGSVKDFVDEIVAVDTGSTDGSLETLKKIALGEKKLKVFSFAGKAPWDFSNFAIERTNYRWIMKWDPDFIAAPGVQGGLAGFTAYLRALHPGMYYYISSRFIEVAGDFSHQFPGLRVRGDIETFTYSEAARYIQVARTAARSPYPVKLPPGYCPDSFSLRLEGVKLPFYYRILSFDKVSSGWAARTSRKARGLKLTRWNRCWRGGGSGIWIRPRSSTWGNTQNCSPLMITVLENCRKT